MAAKKSMMLLCFVCVASIASAVSGGYGSSGSGGIHRPTPSLTQPSYGSGECCGVSGTSGPSGYLAAYGSGGYGSGVRYDSGDSSGYGSSGGLRPIYTNVISGSNGYGSGYGFSGYSRPQNYPTGGYGPASSPVSGYNRPSYGPSIGSNMGSYGNFPANDGFGNYQSGGYGSLPGGDIPWR